MLMCESTEQFQLKELNYYTILYSLTLPPRHVRWKMYIGIDGAPSWGSSVRRPGSEDTHRHLRNFHIHFRITKLQWAVQRDQASLIFHVPLGFYFQILCRERGGGYGAWRFNNIWQFQLYNKLNMYNVVLHGWPSGGSSSSRHRTGDPHQRERKLVRA